MGRNIVNLITSDLVSRAFKALVNVYVDQKPLDILLKFVTFMNLAKKFISNKLPLTAWPFHACIANVDFNELRYSFYIARGYDFNIYLNPYFHEYDVTRFVSRSLILGDVFLDVGAHGGLYTLIAAKKVGSHGRVLSFEPNPLNLFFLKLNIELNALDNVTVIPKAISDRPGKITFYYSLNNTALTSALRREGKSIEAEATTLDGISKTQRLNFVKILKVDTEGYDLKVLKGALNTLRRTQYVIVEQNTFDVRRLLLNGGFQLSILKPSGYLLATNKTFKC